MREEEMIEPSDVETAMQQLQMLLERMKAAIEWEQVAVVNPRRDLTPAFQLRSHINDDLRSFSGLFFSLAATTKQLVQQCELSKPRRQRVVARLGKLEQQARDLNLSERFKKP